ncbi:hypothetical protein AAFF_G00056440 [Aldrovandia affinis]|uniref:Uncharacterized protein n=1 Tax=Aldrovandia affinis TaxID=143900 RepID=A0AAD7VXK0_9TELE|nr:hypothetical protein AAFF_G00056440 [Aldrovandia affinis]
MRPRRSNSGAEWSRRAGIRTRSRPTPCGSSWPSWRSVEQEKAQNQELQTEQEKLLAQREDVSSQLQEVNRANSRLLEQLTEQGQEKDKLQQELEETWKTADKRKAMLDELAIDVAQEKLRHKEELQAQIQSMEGTKGWFERRLKEAEETAEKSALEHQEQLEQSAQIELCKAKLKLSASEERHLLAVMKLREEHHMDSLGVLGIMAGEMEKEKASHGDEMRRVESHNLALKEQVEANALREQLAQLEKSVEQEKAQNQELQTEQEKLLAQREDVSSQLQEVNRANSRLLEQLTEQGQEKDKLQQELEETWKTADKRKAMLDELAIDVAQEKLRHKEELQAQIQSMEGTKGWFERRLKEAEETAEKSALEHQEQFWVGCKGFFYLSGRECFGCSTVLVRAVMVLLPLGCLTQQS